MKHIRHAPVGNRIIGSATAGCQLSWNSLLEHIHRMVPKKVHRQSGRQTTTVRKT